MPLFILASGNLWNGIALNYSLPETVCRIVCMLCVGFLEEVIFRGLLFTAIAKDNIQSAVVISSVSFGIGHIINLFNGSGMALVSNLCQIIFATAVGFLLVTIFYRGGSLLPCILVHSAINTFGTFASDAGLTMEMHLLHLGALIAITVAYTLILTKTLPKKAKKIYASAGVDVGLSQVHELLCSGKSAAIRAHLPVAAKARRCPVFGSVMATLWELSTRSE